MVAFTNIQMSVTRRDAVLICLSSDDVEEGRIQVNKVACNNLPSVNFSGKYGDRL